jgi:thiamine biosynthesis lipoprotein
MKKFIPFLFILIIVAGALFVSHDRKNSLQVFEMQFWGTFDTFVTVRGYANNQAEFDRAAQAVQQRMTELHRLYDIYNSYDGLNNLRTVNQMAGIAPVQVEQEIIDLLILVREGYELTHGTVNVAMGSVLVLWDERRELSCMLPPAEALQAAAQLIDINDLLINEENATVFLQKKGMSLDVGAVAKSYAAGLALQAAEQAGLVSVFINAGGNVVVGDKPADGRDYWNIGIEAPSASFRSMTQPLLDTVAVHSATVSCSGGYHRHYIVDGRVYSHILDPATLMPANRYQKTAVIHPDAGLADILSTALFILPLQEGKHLAQAHGAHALWVGIDGTWHFTEGYARMSQGLDGDGKP